MNKGFVQEVGIQKYLWPSALGLPKALRRLYSYLEKLHSRRNALNGSCPIMEQNMCSKVTFLETACDETEWRLSSTCSNSISIERTLRINIREETATEYKVGPVHPEDLYASNIFITSNSFLWLQKDYMFALSQFGA